MYSINSNNNNSSNNNDINNNRNSAGIINNSNNINPPSSSGVFVRVEAVHLLIHHKSQIYRKLLAPDPKSGSKFLKLQREDEHFIKTIRIIEDCLIQFEFDFKIVQNDTSGTGNGNINLLFHEIIQEGRKICSFYVENMGKFGVNPKNHLYRYTTTPSEGHCSRFSGTRSLLKNQTIRLEVMDLDRTAWFIGEWKIKFQSFNEGSRSWLQQGNPQRFSNEEIDDFDDVNEEDFRRNSLLTEGTLKIPSTFPSRRASPLSQTSLINSENVTESQTVQKSPTLSLEDSFEDLDLTDFSEMTPDQDDSLTLPTGTGSIFKERLLFVNEDLTGRRGSSLSPSRANTPKPESQDLTSESATNLSTVDILHQVGANIFSSKLGQIVTSSIKSDPNQQNLKLSFSTSTIHLLGMRYQLQGIHLNVLLMESNEDGEEEFESLQRIQRFNNFSFLLKRFPAPNSSKLMSLREVLLLKRSGPLISERLKVWFEALPQWRIEEFTAATLKVVSNYSISIEVKVYSLKPNESSPANTPELFLVELLLNQNLNNSINNSNSNNDNSSIIHSIAESNAFFVELTAFIVQMEILEAKRPPEIVLMETWNSHAEPEFLSQSESIPIVKYSVIPERGPFNIFIYFWSDHLQGWLLQTLSVNGMILSIHPLLDPRMAIQINLSGSHLKASQDEDGKTGNFTLITSRGQVYNFRTVQITDLKEIIGRIRFSMLSRGINNSPSPDVTISRSQRRQNSLLLQADKIYKGAGNTSGNANSGSINNITEGEYERIRNQNLSVMDSFLEDFRTRFWFTYRRNFPRIEPSLFTTDLGWGCMLRTGQCLMAEALTRFYFGRNWRLWQVEEAEAQEAEEAEERDDKAKIEIMKQFYMKILNQFIDQAKGEYSVHKLAMEGAKIGRPIGQWFGPSIIGKVLKSITNNLKDSPFWVYLSPDGTFPTSHLLKIVSQRAALILLPLRLGIETVNPIYGQFIRGALRSPCSLGIVGGLPDKSLYFVGYQDWELFFLDPHILKPFDPQNFTSPRKLIEDYHTARVRSIPIEEIDPSMCFGFLCCSAEEVVQLKDHLVKLNRHANILSIKTD